MPRFRLLLRQLRQSQELSQEELARALQVSRQSIISLERGEYLPSAPVLIALMEFFNCSLPELIEGVNIQSPVQALAEPLTTLEPSAGIGTMNLYEAESYFEIEMQLPGFLETEIDLEMTENTLTIHGQKSASAESDAKTTVRQEWQSGSFERSIRFETPIQDTAVEAKLENGILTIVAPKAKPTEPRTTRIQIKRN